MPRLLAYLVDVEHLFHHLTLNLYGLNYVIYSHYSFAVQHILVYGNNLFFIDRVFISNLNWVVQDFKQTLISFVPLGLLHAKSYKYRIKLNVVITKTYLESRYVE